MFMLIAYFSTKKYLHIFEQCFLFFLLLVCYTSFLSIITVNLELWKLSEKSQHLIAFRLYGMLFVPITLLWAIDLWQTAKRSFYSSAVLIICLIATLFLGDFLLRNDEVYQYRQWNQWMSLIVWVITFLGALFAQKLFRILLRKEGILS